jgi:hypothetical protein
LVVQIRVNVTKAEDKYTVRQLVSNQGIPKVRKLLETLIEEFRGTSSFGRVSEGLSALEVCECNAC